MYTKHELDLIDNHLRPHYAGLIYTTEQAAVVEALEAVRQRKATVSVVKALVTLARGHAVAPGDDHLIRGLEDYVALAWRETQRDA